MLFVQQDRHYAPIPQVFYKGSGANVASRKDRFSPGLNCAVNTALIVAVFIAPIDGSTFHPVHSDSRANCFPLPKMARYYNRSFPNLLCFFQCGQTRPRYPELVVLGLKFSIVVNLVEGAPHVPSHILTKLDPLTSF